MAVESMLDPEEDIERVGDDSFSFHYETRAILLNCENRVPVTSKKTTQEVSLAAWIWDISWTAGTTEMWRALMEAMWEESPEAPPPPSEDPRVNV